MNRQEFIYQAGLAGTALTLLKESNVFFTKNNASRVNIGLIGTGLRGQNHLDMLLRREDVNLVAICDIDERMLSAFRSMISR